MRDKYRFTRFFHRQDWWRNYYCEFHSYRYNHMEDGYSLYDTEEEAVRAFKRQRRLATQFANEVCGRL